MVAGEVVGEISGGLCVLIAIAPQDDQRTVVWMARKLAALRIFEDESGKMNRSVIEAAGSILLVSQFTLLADASHGHRPSFIGAARPEQADPLVQALAAQLRAGHGLRIEEGRFGAQMLVELCNDGPVTIILDSPAEQG